MMNDAEYCRNCGKRIWPDVPECPNCGASLPPGLSAAKPEQLHRSSPTPATPPQTRAQYRAGKRSLGPIALVAVLLVLIIGAGTAAAFNVPLFDMNANRSIGQMLPASTVFYISANLNPAGTIRTNLDRIERAYTSQPGWRHVATTFNSATTQAKGSNGDCFRQTTNQITNNLKNLGQDTALVMTGTGGLNLSGPHASLSRYEAALKRAFVVVAPLHRKVTLVDALSGFSFSLQQRATSYAGTTIYEETFNSCARASAGQAQTVYAALVKNWAVLGLSPQAIYPIVDTANGKKQPLSSEHVYRTLMARLPSQHLGTYFLNGPSLKRIGLDGALKRYSPASGSPISSQNLTGQTMASALSAEKNGVLFTNVSNVTSTSRLNPSAGALSPSLPANLLGLLSIRINKKSLQSAVTSLESNPLSATMPGQLRTLVRDFTSDLSGELDVILFNPSKARAASPSTIPLSLAWQVSSESAARAHLSDAVKTLGAKRRVTSHQATDGTQYFSYGGTGYSVRKGWAVVSLSINDALNALTTPPSKALSSNPAYQRVASVNYVPSSIFYLNIPGLRRALQRDILPTAPASQRSLYESYISPWITPLGTISASSGTTHDHKLNVSNLYIDVR